MANIDIEGILKEIPEDGRVPKTKIVCTLGPASRSVPMLEKLLRAGMNVARFNFSHGTHEYHQETLENLNAMQNTQILCALMLDTKGPEIRTGFLKDGKPIQLTEGQEITVSTDYTIKGDTETGAELGNLHSTDGDKNVGIGLQSASSIDHSDSGSSKCVYESYRPKLIALNGCCRSEASQLLHERWKGAIHCYSDPTVDLSERPVMYTGSAASAWGNFRLPHQLMAPPQMDFMAELQHAINNNSSSLMN